MIRADQAKASWIVLQNRVSVCLNVTLRPKGARKIKLHDVPPPGQQWNESDQPSAWLVYRLKRFFEDVNYGCIGSHEDWKDCPQLMFHRRIDRPLFWWDGDPVYWVKDYAQCIGAIDPKTWQADFAWAIPEYVDMVVKWFDEEIQPIVSYDQTIRD